MTVASPSPIPVKPLLAVLAGTRQKIAPIWLMRQAGRYLPEYREIRSKAQSFIDFCYSPALATEATLQPIRRFGFDAAILFSDILVMPDALGQGVSFESGEGPRLKPIETAADFAELRETPDWSRLAPVFETVERVRAALPAETALIGFCGAPWTVASYMIAGRGTPDQAPARMFAYREPELFSRLIERLADASAAYLLRKIEAGAEVVQIFDSWSGVLPPTEFERWCVAPVERIVEAVRAAAPAIPIIAFPRGAGDPARQIRGCFRPRGYRSRHRSRTACRRGAIARWSRTARQSRPAGAAVGRTGPGGGRRAGSRGLRRPAAHIQSRPRHSSGNSNRPRRAPDFARARWRLNRTRWRFGFVDLYESHAFEERFDMASVAESGTFEIGGEIAVHRLGYGAMRITGRGIWGDPADRAGAIATLKALPGFGVDFVDTADSYGPDVSEELIREALHPYGGILVATKAGLTRTGPNQWIPLGRPEYLIQQAHTSRRRLGVETIGLWQLHRIDSKVPRDEQFGAIKSLISAGVVRHAGLSEVSVVEIEAAQKHFKVATVQNRYNFADRSSEDVLDYCEKHGIGFIPWFPLGAGDLARPGSALDAVAHAHKATPSQIALAWLLKRSPVMLPIPGTSQVAHLEENIAAATIRLTDAEFAMLDQAGRAGGR